jgi:two-component system sensor histidine kinase/response regulator
VSENRDENHFRQIESQITSYRDLVDVLELTVAEQSERLEHSHEAEALLAALVESSDDAVIGIGLDLKVMFWNRAAQQVIGYTAREAIGQDPVSLYIPPARRDFVRETIRKDFQKLENQPEVVRRLEAPIMRKDGSVFEASIAACGIRDSSSRRLGMSVIIIDISERKRLEREQALLAAIVESSDDAIVSLAPDLTITSWNKGAEKLLGFTAAEAVGQPTSIYIPYELRERAERFLRHLIGKLDHVNSFEAKCMRKDGTRVDTWTVTFGIRDREGRLIGMSAIHRDLTQRKRAERERETMASIVNACEDAIVAVDRNGRIIVWNPAAERVYGFKAQEAYGHGLELFTPPEELQQALETDRRILRTGETTTYEHHPVSKDGKPLVSQVNVFPLRDAAGSIIGVGGVARDITKLKQIEKELRGAQEYTRGLIESSIDAMVVVDRELRITDCNEQLAVLTGIPKKILIGSRFESYFENSARAAAAIEKTLADGLVTNYDLVMRPAGGREIQVSFNASIFYSGGKVVGIFGVAHDVTEERATKQILEAERVYSRSLFDSSNNALLVCDANLVLTDVNRRAAELTGYSSDELKGIKLASLFTDPAQMTATVNHLLKAEADVNSAVELSLLTKNANQVPVSLSASVYKNGDVANRGILVSITDISENKRYEEQRSLLASIVDSSGDAIYTEGLDLTITSWNAAAEKLFGYRADEIMGRNASVLVPLERRAELMKTVAQIRSTGRGERFETTRLRKDGSAVEIDLTISPLPDSSGRLRAMSLIARDIGERKRLEAELTAARDSALEAARLKSEFLANMSHEIRTPLNSVIGMTGLLLDTQLTPEQREYANDVRESGDTLLRLINDILDFSKIAAGKLVLEEVDFELTRTVESAVEMVADLARRKGLEMTVSIDPEAPQFLHGDPARLRQVLLNLLSNAIKFTAHGEVALQVNKLSENPKETMLRFEVRDTGIGIPKDKLHLLFQPFTQVDASTTRHFGGTGLGLSIVKQLVERMGGTIAVTSVPEVGSSFCFTIQLGKQVDVTRPASESFAHFTGVRVLIVDDNENSRQMLTMQTMAWGMEADTASSTEQALQLMRKAAAARQPYPVALVDVMMPEVDGIELARLIKSDPALSLTAIIFISSVGPTDAVRLRMRNLQFSGWLMKPVPQSLLYNALAKVLAQPDVSAAVDAPAKVGAEVPAHAKGHSLLVGDRKPRILVAEDNPLNQKLARLQLGKLGMEVDTVGNGREALEALVRIPYDVVLMDCQMPEMDGYEAAREIRRREGAQRHTKIVAMTAHALTGDRDKCLEAGMDAYVSKPVRIEVLETTLKEMIGKGKSAPSDAGAASPAVNSVGAAAINGSAAPLDPNTIATLRNDGMLDEMSELFLTDTPATIERIGAAFALKDFKTAARESHRLKGSAAALGAQPMFELCQQLQLMGSIEDLEKAQPLFGRLKLEAERACRALRAEGSEASPPATGN